MQIDCIGVLYFCKNKSIMRLISAFFRFMFMSTLDVKIFFGIISVFGLLMLLGSIPEETKPIEPWVKADRGYTKQYKTRSHTSKDFYEYKKPAWDNDRKEQTEEWENFLEELDNRGYDLWDPEAEDIWEKYN